MPASVLTQAEIDKLLSEVDLNEPVFEPSMNPIKTYTLTPKKKVVHHEFHYEPPKRKPIGIVGYCGCGKKLKEIKIVARNRKLSGFWCESCDVNYSIETVQSWRQI